ncbi:MAG: branched chain amino acid aminotransferase [Congregibacter sp.]
MMGTECCRIAMWSGPRNISTAMMRAFENRDDCMVVDEPFYATYLAATGIDHPGRDEILASQPQDWQTVVSQLLGETPTAVFYQKHMTQHILPGRDLTFTESLRNCFLIRDPRRIIASYAKVRLSFTLEELGFPQQKALFDRECERLGEAPPVLDAARTLAQPEVALRQLCERLDIPFTASMLSWPAGKRDSDGVWAPHWYSAVWESTGFSSGEEEQRKAVTLSAEHEALCATASAFYEGMLAYALEAPLKPSGGESRGYG